VLTDRYMNIVRLLGEQRPIAKTSSRGLTLPMRPFVATRDIQAGASRPTGRKLLWQAALWAVVACLGLQLVASGRSTEMKLIAHRPSMTQIAPSASVALDPPGRIVRHGTGLYLDGKPYTFVGVAVPNGTTLWSVNAGCGGQLSDAGLDQLFASVPPRTVVSMWATSQLGWNRWTKTVDFTAIDRAVAAAARRGIFLNLSLSTQQGYCGDSHWKGEAWYAGGYRQAAPDDETKLSYLDWVRRIVPRYATGNTVAMWTPMVEPDASSCAAGLDGAACYGHLLPCSATAAATLRSFYATVSREVKRLDPGHLVVSGTRGATDCGVQGSQYAELHRLANIDACDLHPYGVGDKTLPDSNRDDIAMCSGVGKATIVGEMGIEGGDAQTTCPSFSARATIFGDKFAAYQASGAAGLVLWAWAPKVTGCTMAIFPGDPTLAVAGRYTRA